MKKGYIILCCLVILLTGTTGAQPGTPDANFAGDGVLFFKFGSGGNYGDEVVVADDGTIWVAGVSFNAAAQMALAKILPDGTPDESFDFDGGVGINVDGSPAIATNLAVQPDGKVVLVGRSVLNDGDFAVARINPDGTLDNTFGGGDGRLRVDFGGSDTGQAVAILPDGKILVGGYSETDPVWKIAVARLHADGTLDTDFAGDGMQALLFGTVDIAYDILVMPDGKIVLAGYTEVSPGFFDFALYRLQPDGSPDLSFGTNGLSSVDINGQFEVGRSLAMQSDGKIVVAGWTGGAFGIARFLSDGTPDPSFSADGVNFTEFGASCSGQALVIQPDGRLVVGGYVVDQDLEVEVFGAARYQSDGSLDPEFGEGGVAILDLGDNGLADFGEGIALQPDGKLVMVGTGLLGTESHIAIARILTGLNVGLFEAGLENIQSYVYPNPVGAGEEIQLQYELQAGAEVQIELTDQLGRNYPLFSGYRWQGPQAESFTLPAGLSSGVYYLHIRTPNGQSSIRVQVP